MEEEDIKNMNPEQLKELQKQNCIFCHIVSGKVPAMKVHDSKNFIAILNINPASKGHLLILPKEHIPIMQQLPKEHVSELAVLSKKLSNAMLKALRVEGTTIFAASGPAAGQKAPHFFLHIIPRSENDGLMKTTPLKMDEKDIEKLKQAITGK